MNEFNSASFRAMGEYLTQSQTLTHLSLSSLEHQSDGAIRIVTDKALEFLRFLNKNRTLVKLDMSGIHFGDEGAKILGKYLEQNDSLEHLNIKNTGIRTEGFKAIVEGLENNETLLVLNMSVSNTVVSLLFIRMKLNSNFTAQ